MGKTKRGKPKAPRIHLFHRCWCGSAHEWEKAKHGTVDGRTEQEIAAILSQQHPK